MVWADAFQKYTHTHDQPDSGKNAQHHHVQKNVHQKHSDLAMHVENMASNKKAYDNNCTTMCEEWTLSHYWREHKLLSYILGNSIKIVVKLKID